MRVIQGVLAVLVFSQPVLSQTHTHQCTPATDAARNLGQAASSLDNIACPADTVGLCAQCSCSGRGACLLCDDNAVGNSFTCEIDPGYFTSKEDCADDIGIWCEGVKPKGNLVHGAQVHLKQPDHGTYLGMCGHVTRCSGSKYGVFGYPSSTDSRTTWTVEREGNYIHLKQANHNAYLGFCGNSRGCDGSSHGAYGYSSRSHHRTKFQIEQSGSDYYLKQVDHKSYLGMCGNQKWCGGSHHGVLGYSSKKSRTRWQIVLKEAEESEEETEEAEVAAESEREAKVAVNVA